MAQGISRADAINKAIADGILPDQITDEILAFYGHFVSNPTAGLPVGAVIISEQVKTDLENLDKARQANALPNQILPWITGILGWAKSSGIIGLSLPKSSGIIGLSLLFFVGCGDQRMAQHVVNQTSLSVKALNEQHLSFEERYIDDYKKRETERILELHARARQSATIKVQMMEEQTVRVEVKAEDGSKAYKEEKKLVPIEREMIPTNVAQALETQKARLLTEMASNIILMRGQQAKICENAQNASIYLEALNAYFTEKQITYENMLVAQKSLLDFIETFIAKKE